MFSEEDYDTWNIFCPDNKIKQTDLANPTEAFLTKTLISYLQKFGYDINPSMQYPQKANEVDNLREHRLFLIKIVKRIDHILKITDKAYLFTYNDLIHPTPKKTSDLLFYLLKYLCYFNMYKTDVFTKVGAVMKKRDELMKRVQEAEQDNLARMLKAKKIKEIAQLSEKLPEAQTAFASLKAAQLKQRKEIQQIEEAFRCVKTKLDELNLQKCNLKKKIMSDNEPKELQAKLKNLQHKIEKQNEQEATTKSNLKESTDDIKIVQDLLKKITETQEMLLLCQLPASKDDDKQLKDAKLEVSVKQKTKQILLVRQEIQQNELKSLDKKLTTIKKQFVKDKCEKLQKLSALEIGCKNNNEQLVKKQQNIYMIDCMFTEQENLSRYLQKNNAFLMNPYKA